MHPDDEGLHGCARCQHLRTSHYSDHGCTAIIDDDTRAECDCAQFVETAS